MATSETRNQSPKDLFKQYPPMLDTHILSEELLLWNVVKMTCGAFILFVALLFVQVWITMFMTELDGTPQSNFVANLLLIGISSTVHFVFSPRVMRSISQKMKNQNRLLTILLTAGIGSANLPLILSDISLFEMWNQMFPSTELIWNPAYNLYLCAISMLVNGYLSHLQMKEVRYSTEYNLFLYRQDLYRYPLEQLPNVLQAVQQHDWDTLLSLPYTHQKDAVILSLLDNYDIDVGNLDAGWIEIHIQQDQVSGEYDINRDPKWLVYSGHAPNELPLYKFQTVREEQGQYRHLSHDLHNVLLQYPELNPSESGLHSTSPAGMFSLLVYGGVLWTLQALIGFSGTIILDSTFLMMIVYWATVYLNTETLIDLGRKHHIGQRKILVALLVVLGISNPMLYLHHGHWLSILVSVPLILFLQGKRILERTKPYYTLNDQIMECILTRKVPLWALDQVLEMVKSNDFATIKDIPIPQSHPFALIEVIAEPQSSVFYVDVSIEYVECSSWQRLLHAVIPHQRRIFTHCVQRTSRLVEAN